jgi:hypothetical protein
MLPNFEDAAGLLNSNLARRESDFQASVSLDVGHTGAGCPT